MSAPLPEAFRADYAAHRAAEGRGYRGEALASLPYLTHGPFAKQWAVRARSYEALCRRVIEPRARSLGRPLAVLDLGAGNCWLSACLARAGHQCVALDIRDDDVDGLGAADALVEHLPVTRLTASFDAIPLPNATFDLTIFNAALHYATELAATIAEAARVTRPGGAIVILDSPFYVREQDGLAMVREKHAEAAERFGRRADTLLAPEFIEFLTRERLATASALVWRRHRILYPLWYELRPLLAALRRRRPPSRFDLWVATR
jgi:SAM-dependent methyltransferase